MSVKEDNRASNRRIAVNTLMLYGRMIFLTLINIYTIRVTLECLGDMDYGIYEAVASIIGMMGFLTGTMTSATQRFLSFHLGRQDYDNYSRTYSMLVVCFVAVAILLVILGEALGHLFVYDILNLPADRLVAARWVYRFSVLTFALYVISIPFTAQIVANEKMGVFAYFSIVDGVMKLLIVLFLLYTSSDRLILYAGMLCGVNVILDAIYLWYCKVKFRFCRFKYKADKMLLKELGSYTGWNLFGSVSGMLVMQGQAVLLNIFFGPLANTAKGIANRIYNVVISFATNMFMAFSPQIVKSYAAGENERMIWLAMQSSRFSFFLLVVLSFPLIATMKPLLDLWLGAGNVTPLMVSFSRLSLLYALVQTLEPPITQMVRATGKIKEYQIKVGIWTLMYIPICIGVLLICRDAVLTMVVLIVLYALVMLVRVRVAHRLVGLSIKEYALKVVYPIMMVGLILTGIFMVLDHLNQPSTWLGLVVWIAATGLLGIMVIWMLGLTHGDREHILSLIRKKLPGASRHA